MASPSPAPSPTPAQEPKKPGFGLVDLAVLLVVSCALVLFLLWLGGSLPLDQLPAQVSTAFGTVTSLLTAGGALAVAFRARADRASALFYLIGIPVSIALLLGTVFFLKREFPINAGTAPVMAPFMVTFSFRALPDGGAPPASDPKIRFIQQEPLPPLINGQPPGFPLPADEITHFYRTNVILPGPGQHFLANLGRELNDPAHRGLYVDAVQMLFLRKRNNPPDESHFYAKFVCVEGQTCVVDEHDPSPGWVEKLAFYRPWRILNTPVYAQSRLGDTGPLPWIVPTLDTLETRAPQWHTSFTKFEIQSPGGTSWRPFDYFTYAIQANGVPVAINGWRPENLRVPIEASRGLDLQFGLENLDFTGGDTGCDRISVDLLLHRADKQTRTISLFRDYIALRDAEPVSIQASDGLTFAWSGQFEQAEDKYEVFVGSPPTQAGAKEMKANLDSWAPPYHGADILGRIRPPLTDSSYGVAIGLKQPTGQVRFTSTLAEARDIEAWWSKTRQTNIKIRRYFTKEPSLYALHHTVQKVDLKAGSETPKDEKTCAAKGIGR